MEPHFVDLVKRRQDIFVPGRRHTLHRLQDSQHYDQEHGLIHSHRDQVGWVKKLAGAE